MDNGRTLNPFVYWAQNDKNIFLKVDLVDVKNPQININENSLNFSCQGTGAQSNQEYEFHLDFYENIKIDDNNYDCKLLDKYVKFSIAKEKHEWWPRLISQPLKPHWLKIDFDKWQSPEDLADDNETVGNIMKDHKDIFSQLQKEEIGYRKEDARKVYLTCYNFTMYLGFLYVCVVLLMKWLKEGEEFFPKAYETVATPMRFLQAMQALEIIHPIIGIMKGGPLMPFLQSFGRSFVLYLMLGFEPRVQTHSAVFFLFLVWSSIEIIRYPYYISQLYKRNNALLTWLRYTLWIPLYPIGYICEVVICYKNLIYMDVSHKWSIEMPNSLNFIFNSSLMLRFYILFITMPFIFVLMIHMYKQRRNKYGHKMKLKKR